ncbi:hypothetical protein MSG28_001728 [Choristoneura fumiferana]|uniref:Uncharacterized protein n=1 Tax=Choristoneura fumiferana TaxID=7141 RepID=A0ACC0KW50_CHOFU|nr:hypothetical protein MSG28_001728 [Choristoneura fumiferana]
MLNAALEGIRLSAEGLVDLAARRLHVVPAWTNHGTCCLLGCRCAWPAGNLKFHNKLPYYRPLLITCLCHPQPANINAVLFINK